MSGRGHAHGRRARQTGWNVLGIGIFVVLVFPVFWMITTAFKSNEEIISLNPTWLPFPPTLAALPDRDPHVVLLGRCRGTA